MRHKAHWEQKSENLIKRTVIRNRLADLKRRQESNLEDRRQRYFHSLIIFRLKALLDAEEKMYEQEFMDNLETPE